MVGPERRGALLCTRQWKCAMGGYRKSEHSVKVPLSVLESCGPTMRVKVVTAQWRMSALACTRYWKYDIVGAGE